MKEDLQIASFNNNSS